MSETIGVKLEEVETAREQGKLGFLGLIAMLRIEFRAPDAEQAVSELQPSPAFLFYLETV